MIPKLFLCLKDKFVDVKVTTIHNLFFWSVYDRSIKILLKTTNSLKDYNRNINQVFATTNLTLNNFFKELIAKYQYNINQFNDFIRDFWSKEIEVEDSKGKTELFYVITNYPNYYDIRSL